MGQILLIKGADFSTNAVSLDNVYDIVKYTDLANPNYPFTTGDTNRAFNTIPLAKNVKIYAVSITLPSNISSLTKEITDTVFKVGSCNGSRTMLGQVITNVDDLIAKVVDGDIAAGSTVIVPLATPYTVHVNEYVTFSISSQRFACYSRPASGNYGYYQPVSSDTPTSYNLGVTFYGEELD